MPFMTGLGQNWGLEVSTLLILLSCWVRSAQNHQLKMKYGLTVSFVAFTGKPINRFLYFLNELTFTSNTWIYSVGSCVDRDYVLKKKIVDFLSMRMTGCWGHEGVSANEIIFKELSFHQILEYRRAHASSPTDMLLSPSPLLAANFAQTEAFFGHFGWRNKWPNKYKHKDTNMSTINFFGGTGRTTDWVSKTLVPLIHTTIYLHSPNSAFLYWLTMPFFQVSNTA